MNALGAGEVVDEASLSKKERRMHKQAAAPIEGSTLFNPKFQCRMYESRFPEVDDLVMVNVRQIAEMGAYVHLLEYNSIEGMILLSELSRRRIRSIQKLIRVGRNEVVVVLRVDKEKGEYLLWVVTSCRLLPEKATLICPSVELRPRISKRPTTSSQSQSPFIASCVTSPRSWTCRWKSSIRPLAGRCTKSMAMLMTPSKWLSRTSLTFIRPFVLARLRGDRFIH